MAVTRPTLGGVLGRSDIRDRTTDMLGARGSLEDWSPALTADDIERRVARMRSQPDFDEASSRQTRVIGIEGGPDGWSSAAVLVRDEFRNYNEVDPELWQRDMADVEWNLIGQACGSRPACPRWPRSRSIAATLKANAYVAVFFSFLGILVYIWIRFGSLRYSFGAVLALVHDVSLTLGALAVTGVLATGDGGLLGPYRIDLGVVAGLLTIIGYSLNDTIVILDRIRENRGRRRMATPKIINASINQTLPNSADLGNDPVLGADPVPGRWIWHACLCFTLLAGLVVGTYSSIAIAAPLTWTNDGTRLDSAPTGGPEPVLSLRIFHPSSQTCGLAISPVDGGYASFICRRFWDGQKESIQQHFRPHRDHRAGGWSGGVLPCYQAPRSTWAEGDIPLNQRPWTVIRSLTFLGIGIRIQATGGSFACSNR